MLLRAVGALRLRVTTQELHCACVQVSPVSGCMCPGQQSRDRGDGSTHCDPERVAEPCSAAGALVMGCCLGARSGSQAACLLRLPQTGQKSIVSHSGGQKSKTRVSSGLAPPRAVRENLSLASPWLLAVTGNLGVHCPANTSPVAAFISRGISLSKPPPFTRTPVTLEWGPGYSEWLHRNHICKDPISKSPLSEVLGVWTSTYEFLGDTVQP